MCTAYILLDVGPSSRVWPIYWRHTLKGDWFSLPQNSPTVNRSSARGGVLWVPFASMLVYWSSAGLMLKTTAGVSFKCGSPVMSRRHCFPLVLLKLCTLEYFCLLFCDGHWALKGESVIQMFYLWLSTPQTLTLCTLIVSFCTNCSQLPKERFGLRASLITGRKLSI